MITSRQLYHEEPTPRPLMPARQAPSPPAKPVKVAEIRRQTGRESSTGRTVESFTAFDVATGEVIATKQVKEWGGIAPSQRIRAEGEVKAAAIAAGYDHIQKGED